MPDRSTLLLLRSAYAAARLVCLSSPSMSVQFSATSMVSGRSLCAMAWLLTLLRLEVLLNIRSYCRLVGLYVAKVCQHRSMKPHTYKVVFCSLLNGKRGAVCSKSVNVVTAEAATSTGIKHC